MPIVLLLPSGGAVTFEIDPTSEDATNSPLTISGAPYRLREVDLTPPDIDPRYASSVDTEGDLPVSVRHRNRHIVLTLMLTDLASHSAFEAAMGDLVKKLMKLHREGGTLKMTTPAGTTAVADVLTVTTKPTLDQLWPARKIGTIQIDFEARPYLRGAPVQLADHVETTSPVLVFTEDGAGLAGDVPALGRLMIDNDQASQDQAWLTWGVQSRYYDSAASAALFYEAEGRTVHRTASVVTGPSGASGGATNNVVRLTGVGPNPASMLSTQATGAGAHLSHVGTFRVYARVQTGASNTGTMSVALEWGTGDLRVPTRNATWTIDTTRNATWNLADLGLVSIPKVVQGTQRWEGRVLAWSTATADQLDIDYLMLVPADEGSGIARSTQARIALTSYSGFDEFTGTTAGVALNGRTATTGGTWATSGTGTGDFLFADAPGSDETVSRATTGDTLVGRFGILGSTSYSDSEVGARIQFSAKFGNMSVIARFVDVNNWLQLTLQLDTGVLYIGTLPGGTITQTTVAGLTTGTWYRLHLVAYGTGSIIGELMDDNGNVLGRVTGSSPAVATGGGLATGKLGIKDLNNTGFASTRYYDSFWTASAVLDAACFASQSLEVRSDQVIREDSGGTLWTRPSIYEGDYLLVPPGGKEARTSRFIVKMSRADPTLGPDGGIDDLSGRLTVVPRYLLLPS